LQQSGIKRNALKHQEDDLPIEKKFTENIARKPCFSKQG
jgi:hypothetical protein